MPGQQLDENSVRFWVFAQFVVDQPLRVPQQADRVRMQERVRQMRFSEEAYQVHRITLEHIRVGNVEPIIVDAKIRAHAQLPALLPIQRTQET